MLKARLPGFDSRLRSLQSTSWTRVIRTILFMAKNLKKFVNLKFLRTCDLSLMRQLLARHAAELNGIDLHVFDGDPEAARSVSALSQRLTPEQIKEAEPRAKAPNAPRS